MDFLLFLFSRKSQKGVSLLIASFLSFLIFLGSFNIASGQTYLDPESPIKERVDDLLSRMTIEEKVGQMTQLNITLINETGVQRNVNLDPEKAKKLLTNHHIGSFLNGEAVPPEQWIEYTRALQEIAVEETRLGIPIIYGIDHIHGASYVQNSTIFPHNINIGATFNPEHSFQNGRITALESAPLGHTWNFAPVLDLGQNPYWPRQYETFGEDPYLASKLGTAYVNGYQQKHDIAPYRLAATAKHFLGYSVPRSGWDRTPVDLSMQTIHEFHRPSFQAAIDAGIKTVMVNSAEINGIPVHSSKQLLTDLLRDEMGFEGIILTDWADIGKLVDYHKTAQNYDEATYQAIEAGVDMSMTPESLEFNESLLKLVKEGRISEERIDESVRRILKLKFELGLFEHPYPSGKGLDNIGSDSHKKKALQAARESMVLLKNSNNTLPFSKGLEQILVVGPSANSKKNLSGGWTLAWQGASEDRYPESMKTISEAIANKFSDTKVVSIDSIGPMNSDHRSHFNETLKNSDAVIIAAGEEPYTEFVGNITNLKLPEDQLDLIRAVNQSGKPTALVLVEGRPRVITDIVDETEAIVWAGLPGFEGAEAIADVLSGDYNPSGKLPFSYPQFVGHFAPYNHKSSAVYYFDPDVANNIEQADKTTALWNFGHGLSYTNFSYDNLAVSDTTLTDNQKVTATATVTNTGDRVGTETVLWYITDEVGRITRPVKELIHFERLQLKPGEQQKVTFKIEPKKHLGYPDFSGKNILEEGYFQIHVGSQSTRFHLKNDSQNIQLQSN
ncbi:glycoside hydrolase family 3 N-terminal domain-containing protein [Fodinibius sp.]|uniref:glycoside hydrolase family 3 N-terminal domain-containing protein n=1 Tax=Fodinibius sp. TaxID=1872440 RepID=UPI002ACE6559|nr:glycoside hydrolase family 3 N-terminal domain-containing protein [Fodinibius sp.]MDZ7659357.1 glycoside hydrolase family 3 N-terminal domain-containing protein [Fodinibius sp.]